MAKAGIFVVQFRTIEKRDLVINIIPPFLIRNIL